MKKALFTVMILAALSVVTGCFTSATAYTKKTTKDGLVTESTCTIIGTGDKVSQIAADGLFADGTDEDLGAGVKKASASQQSTGIDGSLNALANVLNGIDRLVAARMGVPVKASAASAETSVSTIVNQAEALQTLDEMSAISQKPHSAISGEGVPVVAILGNRSTCSRCSTLWGKLDASALSESLCGASVIDADKTDNASEYARLRPKDNFAYPLVMVFAGDGKLAGQFSANGMTQAALAEKVKALVPECVPK